MPAKLCTISMSLLYIYNFCFLFLKKQLRDDNFIEQVLEGGKGAGGGACSRHEKIFCLEHGRVS